MTDRAPKIQPAPPTFTREDVTLLIHAANLHADVAKWIESGWIKAPDGFADISRQEESRLVALADRIEALLPPE